MNMTGNTVLVTGGATGIGYALAEAFLKRGNKVAICGRRASRLQEAKAKLPDLLTFVCDVGSADGRAALTDWVKTNLPALNILVNNAGVQRDLDFTQGPDAVAEPSELHINLEAPVELSAMLVTLLKENAESAIVNVTSGTIFRPSSRIPLYITTKTALHIFSGLLREQLAPVGIKVFEAIPPMILDTELNPEGRARQRALDGRPDSVRFAGMVVPSSAEYAESVLANMAEDKPEFGFAMSEQALQKSKSMRLPGSDLDNEIVDRIISSRRSVRAFSDTVPEKDLISQIIEAGRLAPYAGLANRGSKDFRHFCVISKNSPAVPALREAAAEAVRLKLASLEGKEEPRMQNMMQAMRMIAEKGLPPWNAPWMIIVAERKGYPARESQSLACCLENMWLKATALGLGLQLVSAINDLEHSDVLSDLMGLPTGEYAFDACQIGWPATSAGRSDPREEPLTSIKWLE